MVAKSFSQFAYAVRPESNGTHAPRPLRLHQLRDGAAFSELSPLLYRKGWEYRGLALNFPGDQTKAAWVDLKQYTASDVLVCTTRLPLDDDKSDLRKRVNRSYTNLEDQVFAAVKPYIQTCNRMELYLAEDIAQKLPSEYSDHAQMEFRTNVKACYVRYRARNGARWVELDDSNKTAVFMLYLPELWPDGPGFITSFGMGGSEGLIWNYLIRTRFPELLDSPRFVMAEMTMGTIPTHPVDLAFVDDWQVDFVLNVPIHEDPTASRVPQVAYNWDF